MSIVRGNKSTRADSSSNTTNTTWGTAPTAGSKVIVWVWGSFTADPTVVDTGSPVRTFTKAASKIDSTNTIGSWIFYADNVQPSGTYRATVTFGSSNSFSCGGTAYTNVATGAPSATNVGNGNSTAVSGGAVSNGSNALYAGGYCSDANGAETITVGGGFTDQFNLDDGSTFDEGAGSDLINSTGSKTPSWTLQFTRHWAACAATWAEAATASTVEGYIYPRNPPGLPQRFTSDPRTAIAPVPVTSDAYTRFTVKATPGALAPQSTFHPGSSPGGYAQFAQDLRARIAPVVAYGDASSRFTIQVGYEISTRFTVVATPGAAIPPNTFHPGNSPGGWSRFESDPRATNAGISASIDATTRFVVQAPPGAFLPPTTNHPGASPGGTARFSADSRAANAPTVATLDASTRFIVIDGTASLVGGSLPASLVRPGLRGPVSWISFAADTRTIDATVPYAADLGTRFAVAASAGALIPQNTYHPGKSPGGSFKFQQDNRARNVVVLATVDVGTRFTLTATSGALIPQSTNHPGRSSGGYSHFISDVRSAVSPVSQSSDTRTRFALSQLIGQGASIQGIPHPGNHPFGGPRFGRAPRSQVLASTLNTDAGTRFAVSQSLATGGMSSYLFVGLLGRSDSQLGNMQLGINRNFYTGAPLSATSSQTSTQIAPEQVLILQPRDFDLELQDRTFGTSAYYGEFLYGDNVYGGSNAIPVFPRSFTLLVQDTQQETGG